MLFFDCLGQTRKKPESFELEVDPITLDYYDWSTTKLAINWPGPEMIEMSNFSLVFIKSDHGVLSIYPSLVTPSFGLQPSPEWPCKLQNS